MKQNSESRIINIGVICIKLITYAYTYTYVNIYNWFQTKILMLFHGEKTVHSN